VSAKPPSPGNEEQAAPKKGPGLVAWALVSLVSGGAGFFVPAMVASNSHSEKPEEKKQEAPVAKEAERLVIIPFGDEIRVNLNEVQPHFLALKMSLQVDATQEKVVKDLLEEKKVLLKSWLLVHLGDKDMDDVRGGAGKNMLKREFLERFNSMLFTDGYDRIYDVLFEEFMIQ
jgi:flagellar protein FliL